MELGNKVSSFLWWASGTQQDREEHQLTSSYSRFYATGAIFIIVFLVSFILSSLVISEKIEDDFSIRVEKNVPFAIYLSEYQNHEGLSIINDEQLNKYHQLVASGIEVPDSLSSNLKSFQRDKDVQLSFVSDTRLSIKKGATLISIVFGLLISCSVFLILQYLASIPNIYLQIQKFFWWCGGCEIDILEKHKEEHAKYFGVGGTVLFTALMATFAGGYAFYTAFGSEESNFSDIVTALFFGLFWGALIFNLDRYIVSTFGVGDGKKSISMQELISALPRLVIAFVLGLVISTPLEIKIFEKELEVGLEKLINKKKEELRLSNSTFNDDVLRKKRQISLVKTEIKELKNEKENLEGSNGQKAYKAKLDIIYDKLKQLESERQSALSSRNNAWKRDKEINEEYKRVDNDTSSTSSQKAYAEQMLRKSYLAVKERVKEYNILNKKYNDKKNEYDKSRQEGVNGLINEINRIKGQIIDKENELAKLGNDLKDMEVSGDAQSAYNNEIANKYRGLMGKLEALNMLTYESKFDTVYSSTNLENSDDGEREYEIVETKEKTSIYYAKWLITFLFIFIEIAPILFKMMTESGPYDQELDNLKKIKKDQFSEELSKVRYEINTNMRIAVDNHQNRLDAEILANEKLLDAVAKAQAEIAIKQVSLWKEEELKKFDKES